MQIALALFLSFFSWGLIACGDNASLDDLLNDPELAALLKQPLRPRVQEEPVDLDQLRAQEVEEARLEYEGLAGSSRSTPAEIEMARKRYERLKFDEETRVFTESDEFKELMQQPVSLSSSRVASEADEVVPLPVRKEPELQPDVLEERPITDADRAAFSEMLRKPFKPRSSRNPYDNFLADFKDASTVHPVPVRYQHPLTKEYMEADVIGYVGAHDTRDVVKIRFQTPDGRTLTKDVPMRSLQVKEGNYDINLGDRDILLESERFSGIGTEGRAKVAVDEMASDAVMSEARRRYQELQKQLDSRELSITEMQAAINEQDNLMRQFSPLRKFEREIAEANIEGLMKGESLTLTPGEKRAISETREIYDRRSGNAYSHEDKELMEQIGTLSESTVLLGRIKGRQAAVGREIRALTGEARGVDKPFSLNREWSSSALRRDIGGITGSTRKKEALDTISAFEKNNQIIGSDMSRSMRDAIRLMRSELRSKGVKEGPSVKYVDYLELRLELYELNDKKSTLTMR